jgi:hypothetical protein
MALATFSMTTSHVKDSGSAACLMLSNGMTMGMYWALADGENIGMRMSGSQLQAILNAQGMPEAAGGGTSDEDLNKAAELPLPAEEVSEEAMKHLWSGD